MAESGGFLAELKRRNVVRMAGLYLVGAWLVTQVAGTLLPMFGAPDWIARTVVIVLATGFIPALVFAWMFELTPQGLKRDADVSPQESIAPQTARRMEHMIVAVLALSLGYFAFDKFVLAPRREATQIAEAAKSAVQQATQANNNKSIAVLPFENLSSDKDNAYFASGIQDEILTRLAKIGALKVISRTSTQHYASSPDNLPQIAKELGVANILEGSVQKAGDSVRINVQLIRADGDSHLWAETYDRKLTDIFGVESEVATAIADSLQAKLTGGEQRALAVKPTENPAAYDAYLRGLAANAAGNSNDDWRRAIAAYSEAVHDDPDFAQAWAHLAIMRSLAYFNSVDVAENTPGAIRQAADASLRLQPELGEAWLAQGYYRYRCTRDFPGALRAFDEARKRLPNNAQVLSAIGLIQRRMGRWNEGLSNMQQAVELDPRNLFLLASLSGDFLQEMRRFDEARVVIDRELLIAPGNTQFIGAKAQTYMSEGRFDAAAKLVDPLPLDPKDDAVFFVKLSLLYKQRHLEPVVAALQALLPKPGEPLTYAQASIATNLGFIQLKLHNGQTVETRSLFERAIHTLKPTPTSVVRVDNSGLPMVLAGAYMGLGDKREALDIAHEAIASYHDDAVQKPQAEFALAAIQAWFGETDAAIAALPHLLQVPNGITFGDLLWDPNWDPLRKDPRFQKLIVDAEATQAKVKP